MAWVTWRQHRPTLISVPAVLGAVAVFLWIAGLKIHHDYAVLTACHPASSDACGSLNSAFNSTDWTMANTILIFMNLAPAVIGAFAGAPVLARELETGTYRYAWTQGFGRARWTIAKLVLLAVALTAAAGAFSQVFTWFFRPFLAQEDMTVLTGTVFDTRGIVFAAWTLVAFAIGALAGMLIRRIVPAMAATLAAYTGLALAAWLFLRQHYPLALVTSNPNIGRRRSLQRPRPVGAEHVVHRAGRQAGQPVRGQSGPRAVPPERRPEGERKRQRRCSPSTASRNGGATSRSAGSGPCSSSRPAGCSRCRCSSSPRPSGWSGGAPPEGPATAGGGNQPLFR